MAITPADIKNRFPEFVDVSDARIQFFIDDAVLYLNEARAGLYYNKLLSLLVAHYLTLANKSAEGGNTGAGLVSSYSVGDTAISFSNPQVYTDSQLYFQQTAYGIEYLTYATYSAGGGLVV